MEFGSALNGLLSARKKVRLALDHQLQIVEIKFGDEMTIEMAFSIYNNDQMKSKLLYDGTFADMPIGIIAGYEFGKVFQCEGITTTWILFVYKMDT